MFYIARVTRKKKIPTNIRIPRAEYLLYVKKSVSFKRESNYQSQDSAYILFQTRRFLIWDPIFNPDWSVTRTNTLTRSHFAVVNVQGALSAERPRFVVGVVRIVHANRIVRDSTFLRAVLLVPFRRLFGRLHVFRRGCRLLDLLRLFNTFRRHGGGRVRRHGARTLDKGEGAHHHQR